MKKNIKLTLEYDGTDYHGWQEQKDLPTIQGCLRQSIRELTGEKIIVWGSGRTDAGVHANGQVANFFTESEIPDHAFAKALNTILPPDIVIKKSRQVADEFHAQFSAKTKAYSYRIVQQQVRPVIERKYVYWVWRPLALDRMKTCCRYLIGTHDFSSFEAADSPRKSNIRTVNYIDITEESCYIRIQIEADGFLYRMVRNIVGTLIWIGHNKFPPEYAKTVLQAKCRKLAGPTAPAKGLFLEYVKY